MDTQILLSPDLFAKIEREARARGISVSEFVRITLESSIVDKSTRQDSVYTDDAVFRGDGPTDCASNHDEFLYGDSS